MLADLLPLFLLATGPDLSAPAPKTQWISGEAWQEIRPRQTLWIVTPPPSYLD